MLAQSRTDRRERLEIIIRADMRPSRPGDDASLPHATPWTGDFSGSGKLMRTLCVPEGMTVSWKALRAGSSLCGGICWRKGDLGLV
jgi:hypothetical protein